MVGLDGIGKVIYEKFMLEFNKLSTGNKKRALTILNTMNCSTYNRRDGIDSVINITDTIPNPFVAYQCLKWLSDNYPTNETSNYITEIMIYLHQTPVGRTQAIKLYDLPYNQEMHEAIMIVIDTVENNIREEEVFLCQ